MQLDNANFTREVDVINNLSFYIPMKNLAVMNMLDCKTQLNKPT